MEAITRSVTDVCKRDLTSLKRYLMDLSLCDDHPLDSDTVSDECDRIASEEHPDSIQTINANNPIQYPDKETAVDEPIPFDVEERDRERRMRFEELAKVGGIFQKVVLLIADVRPFFYTPTTLITISYV